MFSCHLAILTVLSNRVFGFEKLKAEYESCPDFQEIFTLLESRATGEKDGFLLQGGYMFRFRKLCIFRTSVREHLVWKLHGQSRWSFWNQKTIEVVEHYFYWPSLKKDVAKFVSRCHTCQLAKQRKQNTSMYTSLSVLNCPWEDISMDFVLGLLKTL